MKLCTAGLLAELIMRLHLILGLIARLLDSAMPVN